MRSLFRQPRKAQREIKAVKLPTLRPPFADVIVVEDCPAVQTMLKLLIGKAGLTHATCTSLDQVRALDLNESGSLLLLDLALDRSDAIDVLHHLAQVGFVGSVVPMSGQDDAVLRYIASLGEQHGLRMLPALKKPFRVDALRTILARHCQGSTSPVRIDLTEALGRSAVEVWFQPRIHLGAYSPSGFEAVVRIRHPQQGILAPARFAAQMSDDETADLTAHALRETVDAWQKLSRRGFILSPCLTVRARELPHPRLLDALKRSRPSDPRWSGLLLKITEPHLIDQVEGVREAVVRLQLHNVHFALSEFGAVAGGLVTAPELRLSEIVLDPFMVKGCAADGDRQNVGSAAVQLAKRLQVRAVAEGLDTDDDLKAVKRLGFDWGQGSAICPAVPYEKLETMVAMRRPLFGSEAVGTAA